MDLLFLHLLNRSIAAGWLILTIIVLRFLLKKAPRWNICLLWALVAVRLICPNTFESALSLIPSRETIPVENIYSADTTVPNHFKLQSGVPAIDQAVHPITMETNGPSLRSNLRFFTYIWLAGAILLLLYAYLSYLCLKRKVSTSIPLHGRLYLCDNIPSPFILGIAHPRIYLPSGMDDQTTACVMAHENTHLSRRDHWWKPLGYLLLALYWFSPLSWIAYVLFCRDIELACDERAVRGMERDGRAMYAQALLDLSLPRRTVISCPLAFGEISVKKRVKAVLNHKKPAFLMMAAALLVCIAAAVCFLTNPKSANAIPGTLSEGTYTVQTVGESSLFPPTVHFDLAEKRFSFSYEPLSSYFSVGTFALKDGIITATTDDNRYIYVFRIVDDYTIAYLEEGSSTLTMLGGGIPITDGTLFVNTNESTDEIFALKTESKNKTEETQTVAAAEDVMDLSIDTVTELTFSMIPDTFYFMSGAGAWSTELYLEDDGSFTGLFHDSEMGSYDPETFPNGTVYICEFSGSFTDLHRVDDFTWSVHVQSLDYAPADTTYYADGTRYITSTPYGLDDADEVFIYLPGYPVDKLPMEIVSWIKNAEEFWGSDYPKFLPFYALNNVNALHGFYSKAQ